MNAFSDFTFRIVVDDTKYRLVLQPPAGYFELFGVSVKYTLADFRK